MHCGKEFQFERMDYCPSCGKSQQHIHAHQGESVTIPLVANQNKDSGLAVLIALVAGFFGFQGIGHIYLEKIAKGIGILLLGWLSYISAILFLFSGEIFMTLLIGLGAIILWIWQAYDANKLSKYYNEYASQNGKAPW